MLSNNGFGMSKRDFGAVAVDLGATSGRFAGGWLADGKLHYEVLWQKPHHASEVSGRLEWDLAALLELTQSAADYAAHAFDSGILAIDAWGVDHGFLDLDGELIGKPICYRDLSHARAFETLKPFREELFSHTGIQHQPFNTICQLVARATEDPTLPSRANFVLLPDLLGYLLTGEISHELTEASTTQLMGLDGKWSPRAFEIARWPVPTFQPVKPGSLGGNVRDTVRLAHVGSHDTASALVGFGRQDRDTMYVNIGTWSLAMFVREEPIATPEAEAANFTNERTVDGRVRFLKNIPGFYVLNRLHEEMAPPGSVADWVASAENTSESLDLSAPDFFNPQSMVETCIKLLERTPKSPQEWAGIAVNSLAKAIAAQPGIAANVGVAPVEKIRVGGGGSLSGALCQAIANESRLPVIAGPVEATVLGNLAMQFYASGAIGSLAEMESLVDRSVELVEYLPG